MGKNGQQTPKIHSTGNLILRKVTKKSVYTPKKNIKKKKSRPLGQSGHPLRHHRRNRLFRACETPAESVFLVNKHHSIVKIC